jgi:methylated-DNA-[protein]-cysteine S-methyltransferase
MMGTRHTEIETTLGDVTLVAASDALVGLYFPSHWHMPDTGAFGVKVNAADDAVLAEAATQLGEYLASERRELNVPLATHGDAFQERVWALLRQIPYGQTVTYGELATELGDRALAYQVGQAVGRNPLCVFIPCHRVVAKDGRLAGYAGGISRKQRLLDMERLAQASASQLLTRGGLTFRPVALSSR